MRKFMVVSGYLGAGKTTTMMALSGYMNHAGIKTVMISNDLGQKNLADYRFSKAAGVPSAEITGKCICSVTGDLVLKLRHWFDDEDVRMVMSDIPGFGVGALEHVYYRFRDRYAAECELAPFTVVTEGAVLRSLMQNREGLNCIPAAQLMEADLIVLNKTDQYSAEERASYLAFLERTCPDVPVIAVSARTGDGIPELAGYVCGNGADYRQPDLSVLRKELHEAYGRLSEYNCQYYAVVCCHTFDANAYLSDLAEKIREKLAKQGYDVPHLKLFAQREDGDYCRLDLTGIGREAVLTHAMKKECTELPVILNTSAAAPRDALAGVIDASVTEISGQFNLSVMVLYKESFGLNS